MTGVLHAVEAREMRVLVAAAAQLADGRLVRVAAGEGLRIIE